ncbi:MAG: tetratricopeptide repeat protein [candidate division Zixibacteria bacterium]
MSKKPDFDLQTAHKYFSAHCFNGAWEYIAKKDRAPEDDRKMIHLAEASVWHWTQRDDCTDKNLSIGYWQLSRVFAISGRIDDARRYGELSLEFSKNEEPFCKGYAYEALARAESLAGNADKAKEYLGEARKLAEQVNDADSKKWLVDDLNTI